MADWIKHPTKRTQVQFHELGARPKVTFMDGPHEPTDYVFVHNPNGSYEAWPKDHGGSGVDVYHPLERRWGSSDYADDLWLDSATGVKGWRDNVSDP